jgi:hypothetical protein
MTPPNGTGRDLPLEDRRRGSRMNSRVPVVVEWEDSPGQTMREEAKTRVVNSSGCLVCLSLDLPLEQKVRITNQANKEVADAIVVWKGRETPEGLEHGIELQNAQFDFWGLEM